MPVGEGRNGGVGGGGERESKEEPETDQKNCYQEIRPKVIII